MSICIDRRTNFSRGVRNEFIRFGEITTSHGIPRIGRAKNLRGRIFWTVIFLCCLCAFVYLALSLVVKYFRYDKITQITAADDQRRRLKRQQPVQSSLPPPDRNLTDKLRHVPVYAHCTCPNQSVADSTGGHLAPCQPLLNRPNEVDARCVCIYDTRAENDRVVAQPKAKTSKTVPCLCTNATRSCLAVKEPPYGKLWVIANSRILSSAHPLANPNKETFGTVVTQSLLQSQGIKEFPLFEDEAEDVGTIAAQVQDSMIFATAGIPTPVLKSMGIKATEFIKFCSFNQKDCTASDFKQYVDPKYGNCYTFNSALNSTRASIRAGPLYGLTIVLFVNASEYLPMVSGKGVRIAVHPADDHPFPDMFGYNAPTGFLSSFGLRLKRIKRLERPYGDCSRDGKTEDYIYPEFNYSTEGCFRTCLQRILATNCTCSDPLFPQYGNYSHCQLSNHQARSCINRTKNDLGGLHGDFTEKHCTKCLQPCEQSVFDVAFSTAKWPHTVSISNYYSLCEGYEEQCEEILTQNAVALEIYYEQLNYLSLKESSGYPGANLLADLGGQLGLWLEFSVITIFEILCLLINICRLYFKVRRERRNVRRLLLPRSESRLENGTDNFNGSTVSMTLNMSRVHLPEALTRAKASRQENTGRRFALQVFEAPKVKLNPRPALRIPDDRVEANWVRSRSASSVSSRRSSSPPPLREPSVNFKV